MTEHDADTHSEKMRRAYGMILTDHQHKVVYAKAYQLGHAHGDSEIEIHYADLAHLALEILNFTTYY